MYVLKCDKVLYDIDNLIRENHKTELFVQGMAI